MNIYDMITIIKDNAGTYQAKRTAAQLVLALKMSQVRSGIDHSLIESAIVYLYDELQKSGCITNEAAKRCEEMLMPLSAEAKQYKIHCVSHAHIDMNWMWSFNETVAITLDTFRTLLKLMKEYPQMTFAQSQTSTYRIVEEYAPEMFEQIRELVSQGRWEVTASTWVETDKNMPSGESLARHILYTKNYFKEKFGLESDSLQLDFEPDTFGHSMSVPEILNKGGVRYYYHCRGYDGHFIYNWRSPSGESILVCRDQGWYNAVITPDMIECVPEFCGKYDIDIMLKVFGVGDHGGGPTRKDIEALIDMAKWPVAPTIEFSTYHKFFAELEKSKDKFETVDHELNYVFTGCYSSQSRIKYANRIAEDELYAAEALSAMAFTYAQGAEYTTKYKAAWERVLFNHFHDILTGSGVRETREHALGRIQEALGYTYAGATDAMMALAGAIDTSGIDAPMDRDSASEGAGVGYKGINNWNSSRAGGLTVMAAERGFGRTRIMHVFNPSSFVRDETIEVTIWDHPGKREQLAFAEPDGKEVQFRHIEHGSYWGHEFDKFNLRVSVPALGYSTYVLKEMPRSDYMITVQKEPRTEVYPKNILENDLVRAQFDDNNMMLLSLTDKTTGEKLISGDSAFFKFVEQSHRSHTAMYGNAWAEGYELRSENLNKTQKVFVIEQNYSDPLRQYIKYYISFRNSKITVVVSLDKGSSVLKFKVECDWHEKFSDQSGIPALKFAVPVSYNVSGYKYEVPFGVIKRGDVNHDVPARGFAYAVGQGDASSGVASSGIAVFTNSIYAYRGEYDSIMLTLLRASHEPDPYPEYGTHDHEIGIGICPDDNLQILRTAAAFVTPLKYIANTSHAGSLALKAGFISTEGEIAVSALKLPEFPGQANGVDRSGEMVIRVYNTGGKGTLGKLIFNSGISKAELTNILENSIRDDSTSDGKLKIEDNAVLISLKPFEVVTVRVI